MFFQLSCLHAFAEYVTVGNRNFDLESLSLILCLCAIGIDTSRFYILLSRESDGGELAISFGKFATSYTQQCN